MADLPPDNPRTQASEFARAPGTPPSTGRSTGAGERLPEGTRLGHFTIRRLIGTGGMGRVYQAQQENPRRAVAIKVMNHGLGSATALRRFEFEAQVLARLKHPGIAQIHEVGNHDFGEGSVPWFAMEYIANAKPITDFALDGKLGLRERLKLFRQACEAVAHGHQRGVIHRDLKPSNLLVDGSGLLKVIDFGVARSTDSDMAAATLQTDVGQLIGTVQYMSPEQFDADPNDLDIRSDVYALGVVLHELLAGQLPYDLRRKPIHEAARIVREEDPPRIAGLPNELQIVVAKALAKDRAQRYGSAAELSQDIERWLDGEPIAARAPGLVASVRRLVRRHRALSAAVASAFAVLVVALAVTFHLWRDAQRGWAAAEARERELQASIVAKERAESTTKAAVQAQQASDRGLLEVRYAKAIGDGLNAAMKGDGAEVRRASRELEDLRAAGLSDPSRRLEARLLAAFPAAGGRTLQSGVGKPSAIVPVADGARVFVLGAGGGAFIDAATLAGLTTVPVTNARAAAFSPDGNRLAVALGDGAILLVQAPPRRADGSQDWKPAFSVARRLAGHTSAAQSLAWSADGAVLASGDAAGSLRLWQGSNGAELRAINTGARAVRMVQFARDGGSLVSVNSEGRLQRWNMSTGASMGAAAEAGKPVTLAATDASAERVALAFDDASVDVWDLADLSRRATTRATGAPTALALHADRLVAASASGAELLELSGKAPQSIAGLPRECVAITITEGGRAVLAATATGEVHEADLSDARGTATLATGLPRIVSACEVPGSAPLLAVTGGAGSIDVWDPLLGLRLASMKAEGMSPTAIAASPDRRWIAGAGKDGRVQLWNALTGEAASTLQREGRPVLALAFSPDGTTLAAGNSAGELLRWQLPSGAALPPTGSGAAITCMAYRPDGGAIALGATDGSIRLRAAATGEPLADLPAAGAPVEVRSVRFSPDSTMLAGALADGTMRVWSGVQQAAKQPRASAAIGELGQPLNALAFDPVGAGTLITASADASLRLWSVSTGADGTPAARELARIDPGVGAMAALAIDTEASTIACAGADGRVALLRTTAPMAVAKSRDAVAAALDSRRTTVQDWFAKGGSAGAIAQFEAMRAGQDTATPHALRDLMLLLGPSGAR